jgi:hypothetical protein
VGTVQHSHTSGSVTGSGSSIGGLVGRDSAATVTLSYSTAAANGNNGAGGLVGDNLGTSGITLSYATGAVACGSADGAYTAGGLVGYNAEGSSIANSYALGAVSGSTTVGGLVGSNYGTVSTCYSAGRVTDSTKTYLGGLAGVNAGYGTITASYWDTTASGLDTSKGGTGKSTVEMQTQSTFAGWDFTSTWSITAGVNGGYPLLQALFAPGVSTQAVSGIRMTSATGNGRVVSLGASDITSHGFCWSTTGTPTIGDSKLDLGAMSAIGTFTGSLTGLSASTAYSVRAYATTGAGTTYGSAVNFTTPSLAGSGTEADPYLVATYADLEAVGVGGNSLSGVYRVTADIDASSSAAENNDSGFVPIGTFTGKFHGGGHVINDLTILRPSTDTVGLFTSIDSTGVVDSLGLKRGGVTGKFLAGNFAGSNSGSITSSYSTGTATILPPSALIYDYVVGNMVGINRGAITSSHSTGTTTASLNVLHDISYTGYAGGLVGRNLVTGTITGSYATGSVVSTAEEYSISDPLTTIGGGLVGFNAGTITNSYATGSTAVHSVIDNGKSLTAVVGGGLVGENIYGKITSSYSTGTVTLQATGCNTWGGLVGENVYGKITSSYSTGTVILVSPDNNYVVGGLVGENYYSNITNCYWDTTTSGRGSACGVVNSGTCSATGMDKASMLQSANLDSLDFATTWYQYDSHTYPLLRAFMDTLTVTAKDTTKRYDGTAFSGGNGLKYSLSSVAGSLILGTVHYSGTSQGAKNAGHYGIHADSGLWSTQLGYRIGYSSDTGTLTIAPYPITVTARDTFKVLDASDPVLPYTATALLGTDTWSGALSRTTGDVAGKYAITQGTLTAGSNYGITFESAWFSIIDNSTTALATPAGQVPVSHALAANIARSFGSLAQGSGAAQIGTGVDATDAQTVDVLLPSAATVQVSIFDNLGTPVIAWSRDVASFDLANLDVTGDGRWVLPVSWNGRASDGTAVSAGVYLWKIVVRTEDGQKLETIRKLGLR